MFGRNEQWSTFKEDKLLHCFKSTGRQLLLSLHWEMFNLVSEDSIPVGMSDKISASKSVVGK